MAIRLKDPAPGPTTAPEVAAAGGLVDETSDAPVGSTGVADLPLLWKHAAHADNAKNYRKNSQGVDDNLGGGVGKRIPAEIRKSSEAKAQFFLWSVQERNAYGDHLAAVGLIAPEDAHDYATIQKQWFAIIDQAAAAYDTGRRLDPYQMTDPTAGVGNGGGKPQPAKEVPFTGTKVIPSDSTVLTDPDTARGLINVALQNALGRNATDSEYSTFTSTLNAAESQRPQHTVTTSQYKDGEITSQSATTSGGIDSEGKQQILTDEAMKKPDYGAYQAASTYMNALSAAIQSPVHVA